MKKCADDAECKVGDNGEEYCVCSSGLFGNGHICSEVDECRAQGFGLNRFFLLLEPKKPKRTEVWSQNRSLLF